MRDILLALWFAWQSVTAPLYPDPALKVEDARHWLNKNVHVGDSFTRQLLKRARAAEFTTHRAQRDILRESPWSELPVAHVYIFEKSIASRPSFAVTDVRAFIALDAQNVIINRQIVTLRTSL